MSNVYVIACATQRGRYWLAPSPFSKWFAVTDKPERAAVFSEIEDAVKACAAHSERVGVLNWQVSVRA